MSAIILVPAWCGLAMFLTTRRYAPLAPLTTGFLATLTYMPFAIAFYRLRQQRFAPTGQAQKSDPTILLALSVAVGALYFQSAVKLVNASAEASPPRMVSGVITQMTRGSGKKGSYIKLAGPAASLTNTFTNGRFQVTAEDVNANAIGDRVCIAVHTGRLHLDWWELMPCPHGD